MQGTIECFYWQSAQQEEVDFVIKKGTGIAQLIQVCYSLEDPKTKSRETRALLKASADLGCKDLLILTDSAEGKEDVSWYGVERTVRYAPLWKWLLNEPS